MEEKFVEIEHLIARATSVEMLKTIKLEYIRQHRIVLEYFNQVQEEIESELS